MDRNEDRIYECMDELFQRLRNNTAEDEENLYPILN